jgi:enhancing lycopene biosynthesis protein 2
MRYKSRTNSVDSLDDAELVEHIPLDTKYTVKASPHLMLDDQHVSWLLQGVSLKATLESEDKHRRQEIKHDKEQFAQCKVHIVQSQKNGRVHAVLMQQSSQCVPWMRNLLVGAAKVVTPVMDHASGAEAFSQLEGEDENQRSVSYTVHKTADEHVVRSTYQGSGTETKLSAPVGDNTDMTSASMHQQVHFNNGQHTETSGANHLKLVQGQSNLNTAGSAEVPKNYGVPQPQQTRIEHSVHHHIKLIETHDLPSVPAKHAASAELFVAKQTKENWIRLGYDEALPPIATSMVQSLSTADQMNMLQKLEKELNAGKSVSQVAGAEALLEQKAVSGRIISEFIAGDRAEGEANTKLLHTLGRYAGHKSVAHGLVDIVKSAKAPMQIRNKALMSLVQLGCYSREHVITALDQLETDDDNKFLASQAQLIQHGNIAHWAHCTAGKASTTNIVEDASTRAESSLVQALNNGDYNTAAQELLSLRNSQLARHTTAVMQALDDHHPHSIQMQATHTLGRLHGEEALDRINELRDHPNELISNIAEKAYNGDGLLEADARLHTRGSGGLTTAQRQEKNKANKAKIAKAEADKKAALEKKIKTKQEKAKNNQQKIAIAKQEKIKAAKAKQEAAKAKKGRIDEATKKKGESKTKKSLGLTIKREWIFPEAAGNFRVKLGAAVEVGWDNDDGMDAKIYGESSLEIMGRMFTFVALGMAYSKGGPYIDVLGVTIWSYNIKKGTGTNDFKNMMKTSKNCKSSKLTAAEGSGESCGNGLSSLSEAWNQANPYGANAANPSEDEQGRCRTDLSGRTNEANAAYNGIKGQIAKEIAEWVLLRATTGSPIGPIGIKVAIEPKFGLDVVLGLGGDNKQNTCFRKRSSDAKNPCPKKSCISKDDVEKKENDCKGVTNCKATCEQVDPRAGTQQDVFDDQGMCIYYATKTNDIRINGVTVNDAVRGYTSSIEWTCHPGALETENDIPKADGKEITCAGDKCTDAEKTALKIQVMYPWVLKGAEGVEDMYQKCVSAATGSVDFGAWGGSSGYLLMISPFVEANLKIEGGLDFGIVRAGIGARINLLKIQLPLTLDMAIGNDWSKHCFNGQLITGTAGGKVYLYIDTIFTDQAEFDIYAWDGLTWVWPGAPTKDSPFFGDGSGAQFWSKCYGVQGQEQEYVPEPGNDEYYTKCGMELYSKANYGGDKLTPAFVPTTEVGGAMKQNGNSYFGAYSMKLKGQCSRAVIFDYDNGFDKTNPEATFAEPALRYLLESEFLPV